MAIVLGINQLVPLQEIAWDLGNSSCNWVDNLRCVNMHFDSLLGAINFILNNGFLVVLVPLAVQLSPFEESEVVKLIA